MELTHVENATREATGCVHYWLIEPANGPTSMGQCRRCGRRRSFTNDPDAVPLLTLDPSQRFGRGSASPAAT